MKDVVTTLTEKTKKYLMNTFHEKMQPIKQKYLFSKQEYFLEVILQCTQSP